MMRAETKQRLEIALWIVALGLVIFFARWSVQGLQPDAALYAGLSRQVLTTGEPWLLKGIQKFPIFFEHPPYFFQWGALVLKTLGTSDGAARAIGGIPGILGYLTLCFWLLFRFSPTLAILAAVGLATFGHYTKFAATSMLEGPLSLGVVMVAIATFELHWREKTGRWRLLWITTALAGLMISTASKGVAGLGAWGGLVMSLGLALFFSKRALWKISFSILSVGVALMFALAPLGYWMFKLWQAGGLEYIHGYFVTQVFHSAVSNRGDASHATHGDPLFYLKQVVLNGWPWWWTIPGVWILKTLKPKKLEGIPLFALTLNAAAFVTAFVLPFSFVQFQLAHYMHPIYLVVAPVGALFFFALVHKQNAEQWLLKPWPRWTLVTIAAIALTSTQQSMSTTENRGQEFQRIALVIAKIPEECPLLVNEDSMDLYRTEAFDLWYWKGHRFEMIEKALPSRIAVPSGKVYWDPKIPALWDTPGCTIQ